MALLEEHRNTIHNFFAPRLGKEATQAMLSPFPARDVEEPVTREYLERSLTTRMLTIAGLGLVAIGLMFQALS